MSIFSTFGTLPSILYTCELDEYETKLLIYIYNTNNNNTLKGN